MLDLGNAGTGARLLMGLLASHPITAFLTGDALAAQPADGARRQAAAARWAPGSSRARAAGCRWP